MLRGCDQYVSQACLNAVSSDVPEATLWTHLISMPTIGGKCFLTPPQQYERHAYSSIPWHPTVETFTVPMW